MTYGAMSDDASVVLSLSHNGNLFCYDQDGNLKWYLKVPIGEDPVRVGTPGAGHNGIDITPNGKYIVVGGGNYTTLLYDSNSNLLWRYQGNGPLEKVHPLRRSVMTVRISPDGSKIASVATVRLIRDWSTLRRSSLENIYVIIQEMQKIKEAKKFPPKLKRYSWKSEKSYV